MKSVIEGLFAGLLDNNNISDKSKKNKSDSNEDFSSDINGILLSVNQNSSSVEKKDIPGNKNKLEEKVIKNEFNKGNFIHESNVEEKNLKILSLNSGDIKETKKNKDNVGSITTTSKKNNIIKHDNKNSDNHTNFLNNEKKLKNNINLPFNKLDLNNKQTTILEKKSNKSNFVNSQIKEKKIKTFFKNYLNFNNLKNAVKNKKVINLITSNSLNVKPDDVNLFVRKQSAVNNDKPKSKITSFFLEKDNNIFNIKNSNENINPENSNGEKSFNYNKTTESLLKNILDIKGNNINQRLAEIFERNIKLGNNRFEIQIKPENLGKIEVIMEINGDNIDIAFKVENNNVASLLSENNISLQKSLSSQGLNLSNFNLNYNNQNKSGEDNLRKEKKEDVDNKTKEEENIELNAEKKYKNKNLVYIKA